MGKHVAHYPVREAYAGGGIDGRPAHRGLNVVYRLAAPEVFTLVADLLGVPWATAETVNVRGVRCEDEPLTRKLREC